MESNNNRLDYIPEWLSNKTQKDRHLGWIDSILFTLQIRESFQPDDMSQDWTNWHLQISKGCLPPREKVEFTVSCWLSAAFLILFPWKLTLDRWGEKGVMGYILISLFQIRCLNLLPALHPSETGFPGNGIRDVAPQLLKAGTLPLLISEHSTEGESQQGQESWVS